MKLVLLSDIHANAPALQAVLNHLKTLSYDHILCMGDLVGYGPQPNEVIELVREHKMVVVEGNHDAGVVGRMPLDHFREPNKSLIQWTRDHLHADHRDFLEALPLTFSSAELGLPESDWLMAHASPIKPFLWDYMDSAVKGRKVMSAFSHQFIFVGHTHKAMTLANELGVFGMEPGYRYIINPGAVGQSRTGDHRAYFAYLDTESFEFEQFKIEYDTQEVLRAYDRQGYPMATRLKLLNMG